MFPNQAIKKAGEHNAIKAVCKKVGRSPHQIILGGGVLVAYCALLLTRFGPLISDIGAVLLPAYGTLLNIQSKKHDPLWLSYWCIPLIRVIFGLLTIVEHFEGPLLKLFPFYYLIKGMVCIWLAAPETKGALLVNDAFLSIFIPKPKPPPEKQEKPAPPPSGLLFARAPGAGRWSIRG